MMKTQAGYTLIEILIALFIFSILSLLTSYSLKRILDSHHNLKKHYQEWQTIDTLIHQFQNHTQSFINRPQITKDNHQFPAFIGQHDYAEWTYISHPNQTLKRTAYVCKGPTLIIRTWNSLSPKTRRDYHDKILVNHLTNCHFRYMDQKHQLTGYWQNDKHTNPIGIQLSLNWSTYDKLQLWFTLPPFRYEAK